MTVYARAGLVILLAWLLFTLFVVLACRAVALAFGLVRASLKADRLRSRPERASGYGHSPDARAQPADLGRVWISGRPWIVSELFESDPRRMH